MSAQRLPAAADPRTALASSAGATSTPLRLHRIEPSGALGWQHMDGLSARPISRDWIDFVAETQKATPVFAELREGRHPLGFFTGLVVRKLGLRILGSPFRGWLVPYMGFTLRPGVSGALALAALERFAFQELGCAHVEVLDQHLTAEEARQAGYTYELSRSYQTDLGEPEERLFGSMTSACRRCIRKAEKSGVRVEEVRDDDGFADEYLAQLTDGLLKKGLVPSYDAPRVRKLIEHLVPSGRLLLLRARDGEGRCIGSGIYPVIDRTAHVWGNVTSYASSRHLRPAEALNWHAVRYWKARGVERFDWGGAGRHLAKYGGHPIERLRVRKSRSELVTHLRELAERVLRGSFRVSGGFMALWRTAAGR